MYRPGNVPTPPTHWWKLNEASGNRICSIAGAGVFDLTVGGGATLTSDTGYNEPLAAKNAVGTAYLTHADSADFDFSGGVWSFAAWVKVDNAGNYFFGQGGDSVGDFGLNADGTVELYAASSGVHVKGATALTPGVWYHVAIVEDGDSWKIFLNGVDDTDVLTGETNRCANSTAVFYLMSDFNGTTNEMQGMMQDAAFWKGYALTDEEVLRLAQGVDTGAFFQVF